MPPQAFTSGVNRDLSRLFSFGNCMSQIHARNVPHAYSSTVALQNITVEQRGGYMPGTFFAMGVVFHSHTKLEQVFFHGEGATWCPPALNSFSPSIHAILPLANLLIFLSLAMAKEGTAQQKKNMVQSLATEWASCKSSVEVISRHGGVTLSFPPIYSIGAV